MAYGMAKDGKNINENIHDCIERGMLKVKTGNSLKTGTKGKH